MAAKIPPGPVPMRHGRVGLKYQIFPAMMQSWQISKDNFVSHVYQNELKTLNAPSNTHTQTHRDLLPHTLHIPVCISPHTLLSEQDWCSTLLLYLKRQTTSHFSLNSTFCAPAFGILQTFQLPYPCHLQSYSNGQEGSSERVNICIKKVKPKQ